MGKRAVRGCSLLLCLLAIFGLSGCAIEEKYEAYAIRNSGITADGDYKQYKDWESSNALEPDGSYPIETEEETRPEGSVCITFAENPRMEIRYYYDPELTRPINTDAPCYVMPGDCIYSSGPECDASISSAYHFMKFNIYAWDGNDRHELAWETSDSEQGYAFQIPADYTGTELSVEPVGEVGSRTLTLLDYVESNGEIQELDGAWSVNEKNTSGSSVEVSPIVPLKVEYQYDPSLYSFVSSSPGNYYHENGKVIFETVAASENVEAFSVQLRPVGDETFLFDPAQYTVDHGAVAFYYQGMELTRSIELKDGDTLAYKITSVEDGYYANKESGQISINAADKDATEKAIRTIQVYEDKLVLVHLPQPTAGGTIQYLTDGEVIEQDVCEARPGAVITMNFLNWNGWFSDYQDGLDYEVTKEADQILSIGGEDNDKTWPQVFHESEQHKPTLTVTLKDGITEEMRFDIAVDGITASDNAKAQTETAESDAPETASDNDTDIQTTELTNGGKKKNEIFRGTIGTAQGITLTVKNDTLPSGTALRLDLKMKDDDGNSTKSVWYITKLPHSEHIEIYTDPMTDTTIYTKIDLIISKVDVKPYEQREIANGTIEVKLTDVDGVQILQPGDVLEDSREVRVTIRPDDGYYVTGGKADNSYSDTMKYEKWCTDYAEILDKHPIRRLWTVTLDAADPYGTCVYELDGKEVSGTVQVREGQKLTLQYTLTDESYQIVRSGVGGFVGNITGKNSASCTIELSEELDGTTVRRADHIQIERKEG